MKLVERLIRAGAPLFIERPAAPKDYGQLLALLQQTRRPVLDRILMAPVTPHNERAVRHIVGMERWGQRRLRVALGEPPVSDAHQPYQPAAGLPWAEYHTAFEFARRDTLELVPLLEAANYRQKIEHNSIGPLSVKGWLYYLNAHAYLESRKLR